MNCWKQGSLTQPCDPLNHPCIALPSLTGAGATEQGPPCLLQGLEITYGMAIIREHSSVKILCYSLTPNCSTWYLHMNAQGSDYMAPWPYVLQILYVQAPDHGHDGMASIAWPVASPGSRCAVKRQLGKHVFRK